MNQPLTTSPLFWANALAKRPRLLSIFKNSFIFTVAFACLATQPCAKQAEESGLNVCVEVARDAFDIIISDPKILSRRCECVSQKRNGKLPESIEAWKKSDKFNPGLELVDCAKTEIVNFYRDAAYKASSVRMKEQGFKEAEIVLFTSCVGEGAFNEMRRISATLLTEQLDRARFREMYRQCERSKK